MHVSGKFALITGAAQGIGKAISLKLLESEAAGVCLVDCNRERLEATTDELKQKFPASIVCCFAADLRDKEQHERAFAHAVQQLGKLHIVANNAGVVDEDNPELVAAVNLVVPFRGSLLGLQYMTQKRPGGEGGVIINTCSTLGLTITPAVPFYSATKHGLIALTRILAIDKRFADSGVRVGCICPNATDTELLREQSVPFLDAETVQHIMGQLLKPEHVADAFVHLASDDNANGKVLRIEPPGVFYCHEFSDNVCHDSIASDDATAN